MNKTFFFCMTICSSRTGAAIGKRCGVVFANTHSEAEQLAWEKYGDDASCKLWVEEVTENGFEFTIYS